MRTRLTEQTPFTVSILFPNHRNPRQPIVTHSLIVGLTESARLRRFQQNADPSNAIPSGCWNRCRCSSDNPAEGTMPLTDQPFPSRNLFDKVLGSREA